jgi:ureidoacrylate peracid hydrolase
MKKPVLVVIDVQKEYTTEGRPFFIPGIDASLAKGLSMLEHARKNQWAVFHVRHLQEGNIFSPKSEFSDYVNGFEAKANEREFTKANFSCFSDPSFSSALSDYRDSSIYIIGYGSTMCCLSTIIEGYHRGYKMHLVSDASAAKPTKQHTSEDLHARMLDVLSTFSAVSKASEIVLR